ncbi:unnamed protein product [Cladocopium goreaui]|uniref:Uncharacterized protein n=1 Tax=Cladocopium goreaui TaxID=2562237 RepID=A0A9P1DMC6_9DINO|nr:unnamed protein product [Cladocopium goreaui]
MALGMFLGLHPSSHVSMILDKTSEPAPSCTSILGTSHVMKQAQVRRRLPLDSSRNRTSIGSICHSLLGWPHLPQNSAISLSTSFRSSSRLQAMPQEHSCGRVSAMLQYVCCKNSSTEAEVFDEELELSSLPLPLSESLEASDSSAL